jgi:hypothetical protein
VGVPNGVSSGVEEGDAAGEKGLISSSGPGKRLGDDDDGRAKPEDAPPSCTCGSCGC